MDGLEREKAVRWEYWMKQNRRDAGRSDRNKKKEGVRLDSWMTQNERKKCDPDRTILPGEQRPRPTP